MDSNIIVDGNHRVVARLLCNMPPSTIPGTAPLTREKYFLRDIYPDMNDYGNY